MCKTGQRQGMAVGEWGEHLQAMPAIPAAWAPITCTYSRIAACHAPGASVGAKAKPYPGMSTRRAPVARGDRGVVGLTAEEASVDLLPARAARFNMWVKERESLSSYCVASVRCVFKEAAVRLCGPECAAAEGGLRLALVWQADGTSRPRPPNRFACSSCRRHGSPGKQ